MADRVVGQSVSTAHRPYDLFAIVSRTVTLGVAGFVDHTFFVMIAA